MKAYYNTNRGVNDLTGYVYNYKTNLFSKDGIVYKFVPSCVFCGNDFMADIYGSHQFCSRYCRGAYIFYHVVAKVLFLGYIFYPITLYYDSLDF